MVLEKIKQVLSEQFEVDADKITRDTDIPGDLGADSLDIVELIMSLEDEFGISAADEEVYGYRTAGEIVEYIERKLEEKSAV